MKKLIENIKEKKSIHYLIISIVGLLVSIPLLWVQVRTTDDGWFHLIRLIGLDNAINEGNFPFLVMPYLCRNFGYSMMAFYPPVVAYIPYILGIIANSFHAGIKLFASLTVVFSGIFMYNMTKEVTKNKGISFLAAIIYMVFPYRLEVIFNRFAIGEFTALVFIPLVFQGLHNLLNGDGKKHFYIAIGAIGILLSHTISTIFTALFCMIYILFNLNNFFKKKVIVRCIINGTFIILIALFFIVPMLEFENQAHYSIFESTVMRTNGNYTKNNVIELWQFLKDKGEENGVSFVVGIPSLILLSITILSYRYIDKKHKDYYMISMILGVVCIFMCTKYFPWNYMPNIFNNIQYPWRMVGFAMFFFTPVFAMNVYYLINCAKKQNTKDIIYILVLLILGVFTASRMSIYKDTKENIDQIHEQSLIEDPIISHFSLNRDYLPYKALLKQNTYLNTREDRVYILSGEANIKNQVKNGLNLEFEVSKACKDTILELPYFYYPGYTVKLLENDIETILTTTESDNGFLQITLLNNVEEGKITLIYTGTNLEKGAYIVSLISLNVFLGYIVYFKNKVKHEEKNEK